MGACRTIVYNSLKECHITAIFSHLFWSHPVLEIIVIIKKHLNNTDTLNGTYAKHHLKRKILNIPNFPVSKFNV